MTAADTSREAVEGLKLLLGNKVGNFARENDTVPVHRRTLRALLAENERLERLVAGREAQLADEGEEAASTRALWIAAQAENETLRAERGEAVGALGPFAGAAAIWRDPSWPSECVVECAVSDETPTDDLDVTLGHFRLAATVYSKLRGQHES